jgi:hypothetical protein
VQSIGLIIDGFLGMFNHRNSASQSQYVTLCLEILEAR